MKVYTYTLSMIGLSLMMAVLSNPGVAEACTRILGNS
jgi:hypothetical protein